MKKTILTLLIACGYCTCFAQFLSEDKRAVIFLMDSIPNFVRAMRAEIRTDSVAGNIFSPDAYDFYLRRSFTLLNYERETTPDGNSAALKIADDKTSLNLAVSHNAGPVILTVGTALNIKDNSGTLFTGSKPTTGTQFNINASLFSSNHAKLSFDDDARLANYRFRRKITDSLEALFVYKNPNLIKPLERKLFMQDSIIALCRSGLPAPNSKDSLRIQEQLTTAVDERDKVKQQLAKLSSGKDGPELYEKIKSDTRKNRIAREAATDGVTTFRMWWTSIGASYRKDTYKTYDTMLAVNKRAGEQAFDGWGLIIGQHFYFQRNPKWIEFSGNRFFNSVYMGLSYAVAGSNTFAGLDETNYSVIKTTSSRDTVFQVSTADKLRNISGIEFTRFLVHKFTFQITGMMGKKQFFGLNFSGGTESSTVKGTTYNIRQGLLFRFTDSADQKARVNFELFLALNDFENVNKSKITNVWDRREIGISASVPFQKVFFK